MIVEVVGLSDDEKGLPSDVAAEFFDKKEEMAKEKEMKEKEATEKREKIAESLEKHIEAKSEQDPPAE